MYAAHLDAQSSMLRGKRILIVEDEALVSMLLEEEFLDAGADIIGPACSLDEALKLTETAVADGGLSAAVLDINLAGVSVWPVADRLAALGVPFVFSTGYEDGTIGNHHAKVPRFIKPFELDALLSMVQQMTLGGRTSEAIVACRQTIQPALPQAG